MKEKHGTDSMGETAENIARERPHITREKQDEFSVRSHQRAIAAIDSGRFKEEIISVPVPQKKGDPKIVDTDERPRRDTTMESLAKLKPSFSKEGGTVTAGNSSGLNDGASALLMMNEEKAKSLGLRPSVRVVASASAGVPPRVMGLGPVPAVKKALQRAGLQMKDVGLVELNEAFAVQSLAVMEDLDLNPKIVNVNGGAIAIGHPLGCSGARLMTTLVHEMRLRGNIKYGLVTLCVGVGQGEATVVEFVD
jgi:acetyl-CoA acetyltransferase family protein